MEIPITMQDIQQAMAINPEFRLLAENITLRRILSELETKGNGAKAPGAIGEMEEADRANATAILGG
jgi:hypothetical protein